MKQFNTLKQLLLVPFLVLAASIPALAQPLNGVYTIGGTSPSYATLAAAVNDLNTKGVSGKVWFKIRTGTYTSTTNWVGSINSITGASATNRITFESESGNKADVTISNANTSSINYIFRFNNASFITVRNMTLTSTAASYGRLVEFVGSAGSDSIYNTNLTDATATSSSTNTAAIYGTSITGGSNVIWNNVISNGSYGIYYLGTGSSTLSANNVIAGNTLTSQYGYGIRTEYTSNLQVSGNTINKPSNTTTYYGMYFNYGKDNHKVFGNNITFNTTTSTVYAIYGTYCQGTTTARGSFRNNNITMNTTTASTYGIQLTYSNTYDSISNNTMNLTSTSGSIYPIYNGESNTDIVISNNNVTASNNGGISVYPAYNYCHNVKFLNNTFNFTGISSTAMYAMYYPGYYSNGGTYSNNTINITRNSSGAAYAWYYSLYTSNNNTISNNTTTIGGTGTGAVGDFYNGIQWNSSNNAVTGNTTNITRTGTGAIYPYYYMIYYYCHNNTLSNNIVNVSSSSTATVYGFYYVITNYSDNNTMSGNKITQTTGGSLYSAYYLGYQVCNGVNITNNEFTGTVTSGNYYNYGVYYPSYYNNANNTTTWNTFNFSNNKITSINNGNYYAYGVYNLGYYSYANIVANNNEVTVKKATGNYYCYALYAYGNYSRNMTLNNNKIVTENVGTTTYSDYGLYAYIYPYNTTDAWKLTVDNNDVSVKGVGTYPYALYAYNYSQGAATTNSVNNNKVLAQTAGSSYSYGLQTYYLKNAMVKNNAITCRGGGGGYALYANYNFNDSFLNNTCVNTGTGGSPYAAYIYQYAGTQGQSSYWRNNIFANTNTTSQPVLVYDLTTPQDMDYNLYYSRSTAAAYTIISVSSSYNGTTPTGAFTLNSWRTNAAIQKDKNSLCYNPGLIDSTFNLQPDPTKSASWSVNGRGVHINGNNKDMLGNTRVTTKPAGVPDLGAYEFLPTSTPPLCTAVPAAPAAGTTQVYHMGLDTVLTIDWPATGTLPTSLDVRQYTGTIAPGISALGATYMYFYADVQPTPAGTYTSAPKLFYKDPWTGTSAETALRMAQKDGSAAWVAHPHTVSGANATRNFIYMNALSNFGFLTGSDISNNAGALAITAPLPRFCAGTYTMKAKIANLGNNTLNNVMVGWSLDGVTQSPVAYNTAIPTLAAGNNEAEVTLGNVVFTNKSKLVKIWTYSPNGVIDPVPSDDTVIVKWGPGLSGEYTVGGVTPDYPTLTDAIADLKQFGVCGPVWFKVRAGTYTGQYVLTNVSGMNATNRVTIQGESAGANFVAASQIFRFDNASFFTLKNISISPSTTTGTGIQLSGASSRDSIVGCTFSVGTSYPGYAIDMNNTNMSGTDLYVGYNNFNGGYYAIYYYMYPYVQQYRWTFENNTFLNYMYGGLYLNNYTNQYDFKINKNYMSTSSTGTPYGIYMYYAAGGLEINNNTIIETGAGYGIYYYQGFATSTNRHKIMNNVVVIGGTATYNYGLNVQYAVYTDIINNSVHYYGTGIQNATAAYFYGGGNNRIYNNVFANTGGGPAIMPYSPMPSGDIMDYNNIYATGAKLAIASNNTSLSYDSLTLWRATGSDRNSISYNPGFMNQTNLMPDPNNPASWSLNGRGIHIAGNDKDYAGNARVVNREDGVPDIGAYEFVPNTIPPAAKAIPATITAGGTQVFTFGQDTVARIVWDPSTVVPSTVTVRQYTGTVPPSFPKSRHMYFYTDIDATPVTYLLDADIYFKDPWTGKIPVASEADIRMLRKESQVVPWTAYNGTDSKTNTGRNTVTSDVLTGLGYFTGIEGDSLFSANIRTTTSVVFCPGGSVTLQSGLSGPSYTYQWLLNGNNITGATGNSYTAIQAGDYSVRVNNGTETVTSNKIAVTIVSTPSALVTVNGPTTICSGNNVTLTSNTGNGLSYQWVRNGVDISGATSPSFLVTAGGTYSIKVKNIGCVNISAPVTIIQAPVDVNLGNDTSFCALHPLNLDAGNPGANYTWSTGAQGQTITVNGYGKQKIWVQVDAGVNCIAKDTIEVDISPMPSVVGISYIKSNNTYEFQPNGEQYVSSYLWIFGDGSTDTTRKIQHEYQGGIYTLKLVVFNGCGSDTTSIDLPLTVKDVTKDSGFQLYPNPAQDHVTLEVSGEAMFNDIVIVNSIGQIVYREQGVNTKQRTYNVQGLPDGHYLIRANTNDDKIVSKPFQIIR